MLPNQMVARWVEKDWEAPRISKCDHVTLPWEVLCIQDCELCDLLSRYGTLVYPVSKRRV